MKLNEISQPSDKTLFEAIDKSNDTGFKTEDLVKIKRAELSGDWTEVKSADDFDAWLRSQGFNV